MHLTRAGITLPSGCSVSQYNLFDQDKIERLSKLNSAIDKIRDKYGDDAIVRACFADTHKN